MDSDEQRLAEVEQVEALVASNLDATHGEEVRKAALSAAETLLESSLPDAGAVLARVEKLLDFAETTSGPTYESHITWLRAMACIRAVSANVALDPKRTLDTIWRAFETNKKTNNAAISALVGMAYGHFAIQYYGAPDAPFPFERADKGLTFAHAYYLEQGNADRSAGTAFLLAQVKMRSIRSGLAGDHLAQTYNEAWGLISEAVAESDRTRDSSTWARRCEIAADIALNRPTQLFRDNLNDALTLFHQALDAYREIGDRGSAARCAITALEAIDKADAPATPAHAKLSEEVLQDLEWAYTGIGHEELQTAPALLRAANTWLAAAYNSEGGEAKDAFECARRCAQILTILPMEPDFEKPRMIGYFILGNALGASMLSAQIFDLLEAAEAKQARTRLEAARSAFGRAREIARGAGEDMYGKICIQYAKTLSAQIGYCGDESLIAEAITAWREAVLANTHDERTRSQLNLAIMLLQAVNAKELDYLDELDQLLEELTKSDNVHQDQNMRAALDNLSVMRERLSEAMLEHARNRVADLMDLSNEADDRVEALQIASNVESRRRRLAEAVSSAPAHSLARDLMFQGPYNLILKELELMREEGVPEKDPDLWRNAVAQANTNRAMMESLIEKDHQQTSSEGGKALLTSYLQHGTQFVLFLRAFELESRDITAEMPSGWFQTDGRALFPNEQIRISRGPTESTIWRLSKLLSPQFPCLMIVNVYNNFAPPAEVPTLFLRSLEWHTVVFCLIVAARTVVMVLPRESESLSPGVSDEIRAIRELGATDKTVIVLEPKLVSLLNRHDTPSQVMSRELRSQLEGQGFHQIFDTDEAFGSADNVTRAICKIWTAPGEQGEPEQGNRGHSSSTRSDAR